MAKLICVIGVTGNQGGSVAKRFAQDPNYRVRGITRNPDSEAAKQLASQGIEIVKADLDDLDSLVKAFNGANVIFSVTNYWFVTLTSHFAQIQSQAWPDQGNLIHAPSREPFFRPDCREKAAKAGISCRKFAYDVEYQQGKNIADAAAAVVGGLDENGFLASTLSHAGKCSKGRFKELYHFDAKADAFPDYVNERHPSLAKKMSLIQTGYFTSSYHYAPGAYFYKVSYDACHERCF